ERAWDAGYQLPDVACALGEVLGQLYRMKLDEIGRQSNPELRKIARMQVERQYMAPALQFLRKGAASELSARIYVEGLIAFYSKQYDMALQKAQQSFAQSPWLYDAKKLEGDVYLTVGDLSEETGHHDAAKEQYENAGRAYQESLKVGRSDATLYLS